MKKWSILGAGLALAITAPAHALSKANSVILSVDGGYEWFASKRHLENTGMGYVLAGYNFTDHWGIEGLAGAWRSHSRNNGNYNQRIRGKQFAVDGVYHFSALSIAHQMIEPFLLAGVGVNHYNNNNNNADPNSEGNINAGAGVHIFANDVVAVRLEARDFYTITGGKNDYMVAGGVSFFIC